MEGILIEDVAKSFGASRVLRGVSASLAAGEFLSLVGPSGCGKTTLLRIIAGLEVADAGRVCIGGRDVTALAPAARDVAMVFQNYALYPHLTVAQNMAVPLVMRRLGTLERLPGVGPKTSAAVLSFSRLHKRALPVDSHHHRVAVRLGLIPANVSVGPSHGLLEAFLPPEWDAQQVYDDHEVLMLHGQRCCYFLNPDCARCPVLDVCPFGQGRMA